MQSIDRRFSSIRRLGTKSKWTQDLYHTLLTTSWVRFFFGYVVFFFLFNSAFALVYWSLPGAIAGSDNSLWQAVCFSVQTFSTIGYGVFYPATNAAHIIVMTQSVLSVFVTAVLTGLIFSKFSRPNALILFSKNILVTQFDGKRTMMLRMGNLRDNQIIEAQVHVVVLKTVKLADGQSLRRQVDVKLVRDSSLFFALSWSVMHVIDETSPLFGLSRQDFFDQDLEIGVSVIGYDSTFAQSVHANAIYGPDDIAFDRQFVDLFRFEQGRVRTLDYRNFHKLK